MKLTRIKSPHFEYYVNSKGKQGEYKEYHHNGKTLQFHRMYKDGLLHGEYKEWNRKNILIIHKLYVKGQCIVDDVQLLSHEDKLLLTIKHNLKWLE